MPKRQAGDNIRRTLLLIHAAKIRRIPACLVSLDIRKAFNSVTWPYMEYVLQKWGFGNNFLTWISSLYNNPRAYIKYAGYKSTMFDIKRGIRQGCPLSPLLFALVIEPLAHLIRTNPNIKGIELGGHHHKLFLFGDDILIFLSHPHISTPNLLKTLDHFAHISGLHDNPTKLNALNISLSQSELQQAQTSLPFNWVSKQLPYLGINLTISLKDIFVANHLPLLKQISGLLKQWAHLSLSWLGRINAVKMTILPKLFLGYSLYLYHLIFLDSLNVELCPSFGEPPNLA